jgi:hypothetical protein
MLILVSLAAVLLGWLASGRLPGAWKDRVRFAVKLYLTLLVFWLILFHEVDGRTIFATLSELLPTLDVATLVEFSLVATGVRLVGIAASITRWRLLLWGSTATSCTTRRASVGARSR